MKNWANKNKVAPKKKNADKSKGKDTAVDTETFRRKLFESWGEYLCPSCMQMSNDYDHQEECILAASSPDIPGVILYPRKKKQHSNTRKPTLVTQPTTYK